MQAAPEEETFESITPMLKRLALRYVQMCGGEFEDVFADLRCNWLSSYPKFDPEKASISTYTYTGAVRVLRNKLYKLKRTPHMEPLNDVGESEFDLNQLLRDLSEDAQLLVELVLEPPSELLLPIDGSITPTRIRRRLKGWLKNVGWTMRRVQEAIEEIREALS